MISLVLIPVLCILYIKFNKSFDKVSSVGILVSDSISDSKPNKDLNKGSIGYVAKRDYKTYYFNGNNDLQMLKDLTPDLRKIVKLNDTISGLKLTFGRHAKYQTFISAHDSMFVSKVNNYTVYGNSIYVFEIPKPKVLKIMPMPTGVICGFAQSNEDYFAELRKIEAQKLFIENVKRFWQVPIALLGIILINILMLIKFNRHKTYSQKSYI